jgi:hypothetical protein
VASQPKSTTFPHGLLNYCPSPPCRTPVNPLATGLPFYSLFWAPHWHSEENSATVQNDRIGMANVGFFINSGGNLMTECASITSYENGFNAPTGGLAASPDDGVTVGTNFLFTAGLVQSATNGGTSRNCTDPGQGTPCANYPHAGNVFAQVGDWMYQYESGENDGFRAKAGSQSWTLPMVTTSNGQHAFDMGQPASKHGAIVYLAGHDLSAQPVGSRVLLNAMLELSTQ